MVREDFEPLLDHQLTGRQPLILYTSHPHFEQTNAINGQIGESTGGVTEVLKNRIILPLAGPLDGSDHVIGHELVHAFQFDITSVSGDGGIGFRGPTALDAPAVVHRGNGRVPLHWTGGSAHGDVDARRCGGVLWSSDDDRPVEQLGVLPVPLGPGVLGLRGRNLGRRSRRQGAPGRGAIRKSGRRPGSRLQTSIAEINREWHQSIYEAYESVATRVVDPALVEQRPPLPDIPDPLFPDDAPDQPPEDRPDWDPLEEVSRQVLASTASRRTRAVLGPDRVREA